MFHRSCLHAQISMAMRMYELEHLQHYWEPVRDSRVALAWNRTTVVLAFRGTASLKNAETDIKARTGKPVFALERPYAAYSVYARRRETVCAACALAALQGCRSGQHQVCLCDCKHSLSSAVNCAGAAPGSPLADRQELVAAAACASWIPAVLDLLRHGPANPGQPARTAGQRAGGSPCRHRLRHRPFARCGSSPL